MIRTLTTLVVLLSAATGLSAGNPPEWERCPVLKKVYSD